MEIIKIHTNILKEHPKNKKYFSNISGELWNHFLNDIKENGITTPLTINKNHEVIKGNQRLKAAIELEIERVPCIIQEYESKEKELDDLIRDNVMRRDIDIFTKFKFVNYLRSKIKSRQGEKSKIYENSNTSVENQQELFPRDEIAETLKETTNFVSMANLYNTLNEDQQKEVMAWYEQQNNPTKKELNNKIKELSEYKQKIYKQEKQIENLTDELQEKNQELFNNRMNIEKIKKIKDEIDDLRKKKSKIMGDYYEAVKFGRLLKNIKNQIIQEISNANCIIINDESKNMFQEETKEILIILKELAILLSKKININLEEL